MTQHTRYLTIALAVLQSVDADQAPAQNAQTLLSNPACTNILTDDSIGDDPHHGADHDGGHPA